MIHIKIIILLETKELRVTYSKTDLKHCRDLRNAQFMRVNLYIHIILHFRTYIQGDCRSEFLVKKKNNENTIMIHILTNFNRSVCSDRNNKYTFARVR